MIFLYFCKFFVPRSEGPPLTLYRPGDSQDYQSFDFIYQHREKTRARLNGDADYTILVSDNFLLSNRMRKHLHTTF